MTELPKPARHQYCAFNESSWTDLITNTVLFSDLDVNQYVGQAATRDFPLQLLSPALHEIAHHACFDSIVGAALSAVHMRARRFACLTDGNDDDLDRIRDDLARYEAATRLLRPLSEGLALFAEFDAAPGDAHSLSPVTTLTTSLFGGHHDLRVSYTVLQQRMRLRRQFVRRRAALLAEPFSCQAGYLPGYIAVKSLWFDAMRRSPLAADSDLFLAYVRCFFYGDPGFAAVILDPATSDIQSARAISDYVQDRINTLLSLDIDTALRKFDDWLLQDDRDESPRGIAVNQDLAEVEPDLLLEVIGSIPRDDDASLTLAAHDLMCLEERGLLHLGRQPVQVTVLGRDQVVVTDRQGTELPAGRLVADLARGSHQGTLSVVFSSDQTQFAFIVVVGREVVVARPIVGGSGPTWDRLVRSVLNRPTVESVEGNLEAALESRRQDGMVRFALEHVERESLRVADAIYARFAADPRDPRTPAAMSGLREQGYASLVDGDLGALEGLAALGLANTVTSKRLLMQLPLTQMGVSLDGVEERLLTSADSYGVPLIMADAERIMARI